MNSMAFCGTCQLWGSLDGCVRLYGMDDASMRTPLSRRRSGQIEFRVEDPVRIGWGLTTPSSASLLHPTKWRKA